MGAVTKHDFKALFVVFHGAHLDWLDVSFGLRDLFPQLREFGRREAVVDPVRPFRWNDMPRVDQPDRKYAFELLKTRFQYRDPLVALLHQAIDHQHLARTGPQAR